MEIVSLLISKNLLDLIFTTDGKEYLTPSQLVQDIHGEVYDNGGRANLIELAKAINVDLAHITAHVNKVTHGHNIHNILGQLIGHNYVTKIAGEINQKLAQQGQLNVSDLTIQYDLPAEFVQQHVIEKYLGKLIYGEQDKNDPKVYYTEVFIARSRARIRGILMGLTRPTPVSVILNHLGLSDKLFYSLFEQVSSCGTLTNRLPSALFIPNVFSRSQVKGSIMS